MTNNFRRPSQCSRQSFLIISRNAIRIVYSIILIITTGIYFLQRFRDLISPNPDEICYRLPVRSELVPSILANHAMKIIMIQWSTDVRIVSPKPYCNPCQFFIIGRQENVRIAMNFNELTTISDLQAQSIYSIRAQAFTTRGAGPLSPPVQVKTLQKNVYVRKDNSIVRMYIDLDKVIWNQNIAPPDIFHDIF
uniref:Uncharacterized protein LOC113796606 n=1 Tax=Dermatophagoides pteronyssinus TaxID=6956 RepID=A0A6P6YBQ2_DERPT